MEIHSLERLHDIAYPVDPALCWQSKQFGTGIAKAVTCTCKRENLRSGECPLKLNSMGYNFMKEHATVFSIYHTRRYNNLGFKQREDRASLVSYTYQLIEKVWKA